MRPIPRLLEIFHHPFEQPAGSLFPSSRQRVAVQLAKIVIREVHARAFEFGREVAQSNR